MVNEVTSFLGELRGTILENDEKIIYIGDGVTDLVYILDLINLSKVLPIFLNIPQHHYILSVDCRWCICATFENDLDFGISILNKKV